MAKNHGDYFIKGFRLVFLIGLNYRGDSWFSVVSHNQEKPCLGEGGQCKPVTRDLRSGPYLSHNLVFALCQYCCPGIYMYFWHLEFSARHSVFLSAVERYHMGTEASLSNRAKFTSLNLDKSHLQSGFKESPWNLLCKRTLWIMEDSSRLGRGPLGCGEPSGETSGRGLEFCGP